MGEGEGEGGGGVVNGGLGFGGGSTLWVGLAWVGAGDGYHLGISGGRRRRRSDTI